MKSGVITYQNVRDFLVYEYICYMLMYIASCLGESRTTLSAFTEVCSNESYCPTSIQHPFSLLGATLIKGTHLWFYTLRVTSSHVEWQTSTVSYSSTLSSGCPQGAFYSLTKKLFLLLVTSSPLPWALHTVGLESEGCLSASQGSVTFLIRKHLGKFVMLGLI